MTTRTTNKAMEIDLRFIDSSMTRSYLINRFQKITLMVSERIRSPKSSLEAFMR